MAPPQSPPHLKNGSELWRQCPSPLFPLHSPSRLPDPKHYERALVFSNPPAPLTGCTRLITCNNATSLLWLALCRTVGSSQRRKRGSKFKRTGWDDKAKEVKGRGNSSSSCRPVTPVKRYSVRVMDVLHVLHCTWGDPAGGAKRDSTFVFSILAIWRGVRFRTTEQNRFRHQLGSDVFGHRAAHRYIDRLQTRVRSSAGHRRRLHLVDRVIK